MSLSTPTPGPWSVDLNIYNREADRTLAYAAPELLSALKRVLEESEYYDGHSYETELMARAAIAKAEGRDI